MLNKSQLALLLALVAAVSAWCFLDFVLIPHQVADAARTGLPRGNLSDLYPRWLGARELLLRGRDPYSVEVTRQIQAGYYGRPLDPARPGDPQDQQAFAYPLYVVFLLAPTVHLPFPVVQRVFGWLLVLLTAASIPLWLRALRWRRPLLVTAAWTVATLGSFPAIQGLKLQQLSLLVCVLLAACAAALESGFLVPAGVLLALATIKPQLAGIFTAWLVLWALSDWRRRQRLLWSFGLTMLVLVGGAEILLPGWIGRFGAAASAYWQYTGGGRSVLDVAMGTVLGKSVAALIVIMLAVSCWRVRREPADSPTFAWALCSVLAVTLLVIPTYALYNQLLLVPVLMLEVRSAPSLWEKGRLQRFFVTITALCVLWPWLTAAILDLGLLVLPSAMVQKAWAVPLGPSLAVPVTVLGLLALSAKGALAAGPPSPASSRA